MKPNTVVAIIVASALAFAGGIIVARGGLEGTPGTSSGAAGGGDSSILPIGESPVLGSGQKATIVFFADLNDDESRAAAAVIESVLAEAQMADSVRLIVKFIPSRSGREVAAAALFAADNGEFESVYDTLVAAEGSVEADALLSGAGVDAAGFDASDYQAVINADRALARTMGARSAPAVFVNGQRVADIEQQLLNTVSGEITRANGLIDEGSSESQVYAMRVRANASRNDDVAAADRNARPEGLGGEAAGEEAAPRERPSRAERGDRPERGNNNRRQRNNDGPVEARAPNADARPPSADVERMRIPIDRANLVKGPEDALVTIAEFSDFHCPYCSRVNPTLAAVTETYGGDVRIAFFQNPLPMHRNAPLFHMGALAAADQGMFWEMHDIIFENQRSQEREDLMQFAQDIGIPDMAAFTAYIDNETGADIIREHQAIGQRVNARGTPHFFINGRRLRGAQPIDRFQDTIDSELALARQMIADGTPRDRIYERLMESALDEPAPEPAAELPEVGASASRGPADAPVTIFVFSEFQCPYCGRAQPAMEQIEEQYGDQVRVVFKSFPLPMHGDANLASQAALAANAQGQFWEYHDVLFQNQRALARPELERYAQDLGLDMAAFNASLDSGEYADQVDLEQAEGRSAGVSGTPTFFINGERLVGAQPFERFQPLIERALNQ